jgi:hypothetical protein
MPDRYDFARKSFPDPNASKADTIRGAVDWLMMAEQMSALPAADQTDPDRVDDMVHQVTLMTKYPDDEVEAYRPQIGQWMGEAS